MESVIGRDGPESSAVIRRDGRLVRCVFDESAVPDSTPALVIVAPPYGKTMRDMFVASMYLTLNGFRTCRFDYVDHVGASDGEIFDFTASCAQQDLETVLAAVRCADAATPLGILTFSIGARVAIRVLGRRRDVQCLVSSAGVVNLRDTVHRIAGRDLVADQLSGCLQPDCDVMGYVVGRGFIDDAVRAKWDSLEATREDVELCAAPIVNICAEHDEWVDRAEVDAVMGGDPPRRRLLMVRGASHRLETNPTATRAVLVAAIQSFKEILCGRKLAPEEVRIPSFRALIERNRLERSLERCDYGRSASTP